MNKNTLQIFQIDAFTSEIFKGNPACVMPLDNWLPDELLLKIAKENNVSETAFFIKKDDHFYLRWFTPEIEMDLCGHATLATAYCLKKHMNFNKDLVKFDSMSGELIVKFHGDYMQMDFPHPEVCKYFNFSKNFNPSLEKSGDFALKVACSFKVSIVTRFDKKSR